METVIAKSKKTMVVLYIILLVLGVFLLLFSASDLIFPEYKTTKQYAVIFLIIGALFFGVGLGWTIYFARLPKVYITFSEGKMRLYNGLEFSPAEVDSCTSTHWGLDGAMYNYGKLTLSVINTVYKLKFVDNVTSVANNINALKAQFTAIEEVQKHIKEKQAAENAPATDNKD